MITSLEKAWTPVHPAIPVRELTPLQAAGLRRSGWGCETPVRRTRPGYKIGEKWKPTLADLRVRLEIKILVFKYLD